MSATKRKPVDVVAILRALERMPSVVVNLDGVHIPRMSVTNTVAAVVELISERDTLREYVKAIKVQATEAPACDTDRLRLVVMYCDDALARVQGGAG